MGVLQHGSERAGVKSRVFMLDDEEEMEGRAAETEGMCFPSDPSAAAFHYRRPEGDPHLVSACLTHQGVTMGQPA